MWVIITKFLMGSPLFFLQSILHAKVVFPEPRPDHIRSPPWLPTVLQHNVKFLSPTAANFFNLTTVPFCHILCLSLLFCSNCVMQPKVLQTWDVSSCFMLLSLLFSLPVFLHHSFTHLADQLRCLLLCEGCSDPLWD